MAKLTYKKRKKMNKSSFALPSKRKGGKGGYPIEDRKHGANALSRVSAYGTPAEKATVRKKVCKRYPTLPSCQGKQTETIDEFMKRRNKKM